MLCGPPTREERLVGRPGNEVDTVWDGADGLAEPAARALVLHHLGQMRHGIERDGLVGVVVAGHVALAAVDAEALVDEGQHLLASLQVVVRLHVLAHRHTDQIVDLAGRDGVGVRVDNRIGVLLSSWCGWRLFAALLPHGDPPLLKRTEMGQLRVRTAISGDGRCLQVPLAEVFSAHHVEVRLEPRDVVVNNREVLVLNRTPHLAD
mmetsp:Transcript_20252/g.49199  ORF Transcript_20252/g.49199 Transcript_20252/m.49199 type:complete len:206 (+) Transcript_20252:636-1253(+)